MFGLLTACEGELRPVWATGAKEDLKVAGLKSVEFADKLLGVLKSQRPRNLSTILRRQAELFTESPAVSNRAG
jgi:hypothetical protein